LANISVIFQRLVFIKETQRFGSCHCFRRDAKMYEADFIGSCLSLSGEGRQKAFSLCHQEHVSVPLHTSTYLSAALTDAVTLTMLSNEFGFGCWLARTETESPCPWYVHMFSWRKPGHDDELFFLGCKSSQPHVWGLKNLRL
jgi:hypothetical protein